MTTVVDNLYDQYTQLNDYLSEAGEITLQSVANENFRKALLIAAGSHFEVKLRDELLKFFGEASNNHPLTLKFIDNQAIQRQFHSFFDWNAPNANRFFRLFGEEFSDYMKAEVKSEVDLDRAAKAFIEIGAERNRLVHQDFGSYSLEKTSKEIYDLYRDGSRFLTIFLTKLRSFASNLG